MTEKTTAQWYTDGLSLLDSGFFDSALECFAEVLRIEPRNARAWVFKATALAGMEMYEGAIQCFERALEIDLLDVQAWRGKALCLSRLGREEEAARCQAEASRIAEGADVPVPPVKEPVPTLYTVADGLASNTVHRLALDEEEVWFVYGKDAGATRLTLKDQRLRTYTQDDGLTGDAVRCVVVGEKHVWFGTDGGLSGFDRQAENWVGYTPETGLQAGLTSDLVIDGKLLWLGTDSGLLVLDTTTGKSAFCKGGPDPLQVDRLLADGRRIWCGANVAGGGLSVFDKQAGSFQRLDVGPFVRDLQLFPLGGTEKIWVAREEGITIIDRITYERKEISLPGMLITGIAVGVNNLLVGTARGLAVVDVEEWERQTEMRVERTEIGRGKYVSAVRASRNREWMAIEGEGVLCLSYPS